MAFLDNSGDIILDAVLTDAGRYRLAQGNGSFKITKFALGDDEIDYASYNKNHPSGSAYYDLEILQTPVLEAFTNNTSTMKSKLLSIPRTNLLYMPVILQNTAESPAAPSGSSEIHTVCCDSTTVGDTSGAGFLIQANNTPAAYELRKGILNGFEPSKGENFIRADQGLNTNEIAATSAIDADLLETQYIVEMDNRLGSVVTSERDGGAARVSFIDDDNIASYYFSLASDPGYVEQMNTNSPNSNLLGPKGTKISFKIQASTELQTSTYLFEKLGSTTSMTKVDGIAQSVRYIDTMVKITGATTGYSLNLPVRFIKIPLV
jgi:hypothetical protein